MRLLGCWIPHTSLLAAVAGIAFYASSITVYADVLSISIGGVFGAGVTADQLAAPDAAWALSFDLSGNPAAANTDRFGFDVPFDGFKYTLDGSPIAVSPQSIRFFASEGGGLFSVYFGPESGFNNGMPIPEFSFAGDQVFSGTTQMPVMLAGSYPVSDVTYSDSENFDDEGASGVVKIARVSVPVPEPSPFGFVLIGVLLLSPSIRRRTRTQLAERPGR